MPRIIHPDLDEIGRATIATAGLRILSQTRIVVPMNGENSHTIATEGARRAAVLVSEVATSGDIRFRYNATADANSIPLSSIGNFLTLDVGAGDSLSFFNNTASAIDVWVLEIE